jgi:HD-GYP domain-containing protein (c-di-GMP phosphodiesterase class II)
LRATEEAEAHVRPYGDRHVRLAGSLASQAAVALANRRLYESISQLFDGFVKASVTAIESRDPTTFGHSFRVAELTVGLAEAVERSDRGAFQGVRFSGEELRELRYAALLHDFGKVGVREHVLVKSKKLYPADLERIRHRIELLMRDLELGVARRKLDWFTRRGKDGFNLQAAKLDADLAAAIAELDEALDVVLTVNEPSVQPQDFTSSLLKITARSWEDHRGQRRTVLTPEEASILAITKGSLTEIERREIQQHVVHTFQFLAQIPWTREFRRIPEIARSHHEKLDGSGYPDRLRGDEIPLTAQLICIVDVYDALTTTRSYRGAMDHQAAVEEMIRSERWWRRDVMDGFRAKFE